MAASRPFKNIYRVDFDVGISPPEAAHFLYSIGLDIWHGFLDITNLNSINFA